MCPFDFILPEQSTVFRKAGLANPDAASVVRFLVLSARYLNLPVEELKEFSTRQKDNPLRSTHDQDNTP